MEKNHRVQSMKKKIKLRKPGKRNRKRLLKKVVDYLKYDSYMFAPLVNSRSHQKIKFSSATSTRKHFLKVKRLELKEPIKVKNKKLLEKIMDYMKSDSYLYASMLDSQPMVSSSKGCIQFVKKVRMQISKRSVTTESNKPIIHLANVVTEDKLSNGNIPGPQTLAQREMIKKMICSNCRSTSSVSGMLDSQLNSLLVD